MVQARGLGGLFQPYFFDFMENIREKRVPPCPATAMGFIMLRLAPK